MIMYICLCNAVNQTSINQYLELGVSTLEELQQYINICDTCFACEDQINQLIEDYHGRKCIQEPNKTS